MYKGLVHFHSEYSYDSILSIKKIVKFALKNRLNFLILTDHETIEGSKKLREYIEKNNYDIEVLIAAEYKTEYGDIIAVNINQDVKNMKFDLFIKEVREQNGILLFPHPYKGHKNIEKIANVVDFIEVFNARTDDINNKKALKLAIKYNKPIYYSTDAHTYSSLKNAIIEFNNKGDLIESLKCAEIIKCNRNKTFMIEVIYSQIIKSLKKKDFVLFLRMIKKTLITMIKFKIFQRV